MVKPWSGELSRRLDLAVATVEVLEKVEPSPGQEKAVEKWQGIKAKLERTIFDGSNRSDTSDDSPPVC